MNFILVVTRLNMRPLCLLRLIEDRFVLKPYRIVYVKTKGELKAFAVSHALNRPDLTFPTDPEEDENIGGGTTKH